jgi:hypothetical protein
MIGKMDGNRNEDKKGKGKGIWREGRELGLERRTGIEIKEKEEEKERN